MIDGEPADADGSAAVFEVWAENEETVRVFLALETQWRVVPLAAGVLRVLGLRYEALTGALWRSCAVSKKRRPAVMTGLRLMEREVLRVAEARR